MDIFVYKTINNDTLYLEQEKLQEVVRQVLPQASLVVSSYGTIRISDLSENGSTTIGSEEKGYRFLVKILKIINQKISTDKSLSEKRISSIFPKELKIRMASTFKLNNGSREFNYYFDILLKPSSREKRTSVLNAEMKATLSENGVIKNLSLNWRPIIQRKKAERLPLRISNDLNVNKDSLEINYLFDASKQFITPVYKVTKSTSLDFLPATAYFI